MINVENLSFAYEAQHPVLKNLSFTIAQEQYVAVMGHNGSGKSTLAKLLAGLLTTTKGTIHIDGLMLNIANLKTIRQSLGIVFQNPDNQFIGATVADDLAFGLENRQVPSSQMQSLIETYAKQVGMEKFLHQEPASLSGGQKQRIAIAGVLAMQPKVLLLDEATAMLDPQGKEEIRALILKIRQTFPALTILAITHDVEEAILADQLLVLNEGTLAYLGKPDALFRQPTLVKQFKLSLPFVYQLKALYPTFEPKDIQDIQGWAKQLCQSK